MFVVPEMNGALAGTANVSAPSANSTTELYMCVTVNVYKRYILILNISPLDKMIGMVWLQTSFILSSQSWGTGSPLSYFSIQPVLHDWFNKGYGMCYPACEIVHIKEPLLLIGKSSPCGGSGFPPTLFPRSGST